MTQYSIHLKRSAILAQGVYFLHSTMPSVTFLGLSDVSVICRDTYFQFPIQSAFLQYIGRFARQQQHCGVLLVLVCNIGHRTFPKIWVGTFVVRNVQPRKKTELILPIKMETRHPEEGQLGNEFLAICNHCVVMTA